MPVLRTLIRLLALLWLPVLLLCVAAIYYGNQQHNTTIVHSAITQDRTRPQLLDINTGRTIPLDENVTRATIFATDPARALIAHRVHGGHRCAIVDTARWQTLYSITANECGFANGTNAYGRPVLFTRQGVVNRLRFLDWNGEQHGLDIHLQHPLDDIAAPPKLPSPDGKHVMLRAEGGGFYHVDIDNAFVQCMNASIQYWSWTWSPNSRYVFAHKDRHTVYYDVTDRSLHEFPTIENTLDFRWISGSVVLIFHDRMVSVVDISTNTILSQTGLHDGPLPVTEWGARFALFRSISEDNRETTLYLVDTTNPTELTEIYSGPNSIGFTVTDGVVFVKLVHRHRMLVFDPIERVTQVHNLPSECDAIHFASSLASRYAACHRVQGQQVDVFMFDLWTGFRDDHDEQISFAYSNMERISARIRLLPGSHTLIIRGEQDTYLYSTLDGNLTKLTDMQLSFARNFRHLAHIGDDVYIVTGYRASAPQPWSDLFRLNISTGQLRQLTATPGVGEGNVTVLR